MDRGQKPMKILLSYRSSTNFVKIVEVSKLPCTLEGQSLSDVFIFSGYVEQYLTRVDAAGQPL